jgi:hypothetical protein
MNRDDLRHLLTAAVDGALTPAERKEAQRLVRESAEARALYLQLKRDSERLRALRRHPAPPDLVDVVLDTIRDRKPTPLPPTRIRPGRWAGWMTVATAAGVMLAFAAGSFLLFGPDNGRPHGRIDTEVVGPTLPAPRLTPEVGPMPRSIPGDSMANARLASTGPELGPPPREVDPRLASPEHLETPDIRGLQLDTIRHSTLFTLRQLPGNDAEQARLLGDVKNDELIRLDLFTPTLPQGTELVLAALKARGLEVFIDAHAQDRRQRSPATEFVVFTEAMTPAELVQFLTALGAEDRRWPSPIFDTLVVAPFLPKDLTQLSTLLGLPTLTKEKVDIRRPLPEGTAQQVADALTRMGGPGSSAAAPKTNKVAVMVAYTSANPSPATSKEIRQFFARRGDRKPDAKPLMLVLRSRN